MRVEEKISLACSFGLLGLLILLFRNFIKPNN